MPVNEAGVREMHGRAKVALSLARFEKLWGAEVRMHPNYPMKGRWGRTRPEEILEIAFPPKAARKYAGFVGNDAAGNVPGPMDIAQHTMPMILDFWRDARLKAPQVIGGVKLVPEYDEAVIRLRMKNKDAPASSIIGHMHAFRKLVE